MSFFLLENGIYFKGKLSDFTLCYNDITLTKRCEAISYIPGTLIALRSHKTIYVYLPILLNINSNIELCEISKFEILEKNTCIKLCINGKLYVVDSNAEARLLEHGKF